MGCREHVPNLYEPKIRNQSFRYRISPDAKINEGARFPSGQEVCDAPHKDFDEIR
jgi:hypothetical protein